MIDSKIWETIYNMVFKAFPPPENLIENIELNIDGKIKNFVSPQELLAYLTVNNVQNIKDDYIKFKMKNADIELKNMNNYVQDLISDVIKEKRG